MKPLLPILLILIAGTLAAQPITYMIPDIGTPGMNTYVEIIAPANEPGKFLLVDGLASPSILHIKFLNPADSNRVKVSPGVVSWNQRLVSFQFFVPPGAALGPVPMALDISGQSFAIDTFFIVAPQTFGNKNNGGVIGSSPTYGTGMGRRSKRGAMIVDEMVLNNGVYTIDVSDPDPYTAGNQGYLPFILLVKGRLTVNPGATISGSAPRGAASKNGGPGGGGGGGYGADRPASFPVPLILGENDTPLGNGFTGGRSNVPVVPSPGGFGEGTGQGAASLNGLSAINTFKTSSFTARLFAAGPGHPFDVDGRSGGAAVSTANGAPNIIGTYYGGGGNASKGTGLPAAQDDYNGQVIGNIEIAPLHGGAGGASGGFNDSAGGGGGGAIAIYSVLDARVANAEARGGDGKNGCADCGFGTGDASAGGAGGSVVIGSRTGLVLGTVDVEGGLAGITAATATPGSTSGNGGGGRFRSEGRVRGGLVLVPDISQYAGPTIDTLTFASSLTWKVRGTGRYQPRGEGDSIVVFVRGHNSGWNFNQPYGTRVKSDSTWEVTVTFPNDSLAYVCAAQVTPEPELVVATPFTQIPTHIFAQSAASIVRLQAADPVLDAPSSRRLDTIFCPAILYDTFTVRNTGSGRLIIGAGTQFTGGGAALYRVIQPTLPDTLNAGESAQWIVRFDGITAVNGGHGATLRLITNDPARAQWDIAYEAERLAPTPLTAQPATFSFGDVQIGTSTRRTVVLTNPQFPGATSQTIGALAIVPPSAQVRVVRPIIPPALTLAPGDTVHVVLEFTPTATGQLPSMKLAAVRGGPCFDTIGVPIDGRGIRASLIASKGLLTIIDSNCTTPSPAEDTLRLINASTTPLNVTGLTAVPSNIFTIVPPVPTGPLAPGASVVVRVRFTPSRAVDTLGTLTITSTDAQRPTFTVDLRGRRDTIIVRPIARTIQFRQKLSCEPQADTAIVLYNRGNDTARLYPVNVTAPFFLMAPPPYVIPPNDSIAVRVRFTPGANGTFASQIIYTVNPCTTRDTIELRGEQITAVYIVTDLAFGDVTVGGTGVASATVTNTSGVGLRISGARVVPGSGEFAADPLQFPIRIPAGGSAPVAFAYTPAAVGDIPAGVRIEVDIDSICAEKLGAAVTGRGVAGGVSLSRNSLDFGAQYFCRTLDDTITITNVSPIAITLGAPALAPGSASAFFAVVGGSFAPGDLAAGASATIIVRFTPGVGADAVRTATLQIGSSDPLRPQIDIPLRGELVSAALAAFGPAVPTIGAGAATTATRWIVNLGSSPLTIEDANIGAPFSVLSTTPGLPATLAPGDSLEVQVRFAPAAPGDFADSLRVSVRSACDSTRFAIAATALDLSVIAATATWGDVSGAPGDTVRIALRLENDVAAAAVTAFTASARFNASMLVPLRVVLDGTLANGWTVTDKSFAPGNARFTASGTAPIAGTGVIAYLDALVALGDSVQTAITGDTAGVNSARAALSLAPGRFTLTDYCPIGGPRLVTTGGAVRLKVVRPNPFGDGADVEIALIESGRTSMVIFDALGRETARPLDAELAPGTYIVTLRGDDLPSGVYYLELRTPGSHERMKVMKR